MLGTNEWQGKANERVPAAATETSAFEHAQKTLQIQAWPQKCSHNETEDAGMKNPN